MINRNLFFFLFCMVAALTVACAQMGLPVAQSFEEKLTASLAGVTAARDTTTNLLNAKKISSDDAQHVLDQLRNARAGLDIARTMAAQSPAAASAKLTSVHTALVALQAYLNSKQGG